MLNPPPLQSERSRKPAVERRGSILAREPLLLLGLVLAGCYFGRSLLIPLALAMTLAFLLAPLVTRLEKMHLRRTPASLLALAVATTLLGAICWLAGSQLLRVAADLPARAQNLHSKLQYIHVPANSSLGQAWAGLENLGKQFSNGEQPSAQQQRDAELDAMVKARSARARAALRHALQTGQDADTPIDTPQPAPVFLVQAPATELDYLAQIARPVLKPLGEAVMVLVFAVYLLIKREDLRNRLLLLAGIGRLNLVTHALDDAAERISRYLIANVSVNVGEGAVFAAGLYAIGIPDFALWGALLALLRMIPYAGTVVGGALPILFALIYFPGWWQAAAVFALIALLEMLVANFLEPWLYGAHTGISELALLAMAVVWTLLWGWPGLALSTPLTVCLIVMGRTMPQMSFLHVLLGDDAELAPEARFYERMLAMDQAGAHQMADRFLDASAANPRSTADFYDEVLLPAVAMAESERHKGALDEHRASLFLQSTAELIAEMAPYASRDVVRHAQTLPLFDEDEAPTERNRCPVVCVPSSDLADELAATMLAQLLEAAGHKTLLLPRAALTPELLARLAEEPQTCLCLSALPPFAFAGARSYFQSLRSVLPRNPIVVGLWRSPVESDLLRKRLGMEQSSDHVATTLAKAHLLLCHNAQEETQGLYARSAV